MTQGQFNQETQQISQLLNAFLARRAQTESLSTKEDHLDEDSLSAFVEGSLSERESAPVFKHLVGCSPCRNITAQLVRLAEELNDLPEAVSAAEKRTNRLQEFLRSFVTGSFNLSDQTVFAHNAEQDDDSTEKQDDEKNAAEKEPNN